MENKWTNRNGVKIIKIPTFELHCNLNHLETVWDIIFAQYLPTNPFDSANSKAELKCALC